MELVCEDCNHREDNTSEEKSCPECGSDQTHIETMELDSDDDRLQI